MNSRQTPFSKTLSHWRKRQKVSQLELSLAANVSQRHISWLETGRSQPSREMVINLSEALQIPLQDRNQLLNSAGFSKLYSHRDLSEPSMAPVMEMLRTILDHHEPYPAYAVDRYWNIKMQNQASKNMFNMLGGHDKIWNDVDDNGERNIARLTLHPNGLRNYVQNWPEIAAPFIKRLRSEALESNDRAFTSRLEEYETFIKPSDFPSADPHQDLTPLLPIIFGSKEAPLHFYSIISTFGTAQDITANELKIESLYPSNTQTAKFFTE